MARGPLILEELERHRPDLDFIFTECSRTAFRLQHVPDWVSQKVAADPSKGVPSKLRREDRCLQRKEISGCDFSYVL